MKILLSCIATSLVALTVAPASAEPATAEPVSARGLAIVAPSEQRTIFDDGGAVVISLSAAPPLEEGDRIVVRVDDQIVVLPSGSTKFAITGVSPGSHDLEAIIVDADDNPVAAAEAVTFQMGDGWRRI
jgi:hypothetical protein